MICVSTLDCTLMWVTVALWALFIIVCGVLAYKYHKAS